MRRLLFMLALLLASPAWAQIEFKPAAGSSTDLTAATTLGTAYGADMVTNGTFTGNATGWTLGLGGGAPDWAYSSNTVTHANGGGTATLEPSTPLTVVAGRTYRVTYTLSSLTAGTVTASIGGTSATAAAANGTYVHTLVAADTTNLKFTPTTTLVATIDTISVEESKSVTIANLTAGRLTFASTSGRLSDSAAFLADDSGGGNGVSTLRKTMNGTSPTSNFFSSVGTMPTAVGVEAVGALFKYTTQGSSIQNQRGLQVQLLPGISSTASTFAVLALNSTAGQNTGTTYAVGGNFGVYATASGTGSVVRNAALVGNASGAGTINYAVHGIATSATGSPLVNIGGAFYGSGGSAANVGVMGTLRTSEFYSASPQLPFTAGGFFSNDTAASPILIAQDNTSNAVLPTTAATQVWWVGDGAWPYLGNGVLTSATATAETQARMSGGLIHSCTWTNAQVVALGGNTAGDITCATIPAKHQVRNAYIVITGQGAGTTTLTVSMGDANGGTPFIDYVVASDAKAAANTVYGDAVAERGTSLDTEFWYLPSYTATKLVTLHFISTGANLDQVTGSTGRAIIETELLP